MSKIINTTFFRITGKRKYVFILAALIIIFEFITGLIQLFQSSNEYLYHNRVIDSYDKSGIKDVLVLIKSPNRIFVDTVRTDFNGNFYYHFIDTFDMKEVPSTIEIKKNHYESSVSYNQDLKSKTPELLQLKKVSHPDDKIIPKGMIMADIKGELVGLGNAEICIYLNDIKLVSTVTEPNGKFIFRQGIACDPTYVQGQEGLSKWVVIKKIGYRTDSVFIDVSNWIYRRLDAEKRNTVKKNYIFEVKSNSSLVDVELIKNSKVINEDLSVWIYVEDDNILGEEGLDHYPFSYRTIVELHINKKKHKNWVVIGANFSEEKEARKDMKKKVNKLVFDFFNR